MSKRVKIITDFMQWIEVDFGEYNDEVEDMADYVSRYNNKYKDIYKSHRNQIPKLWNWIRSSLKQGFDEYDLMHEMFENEYMIKCDDFERYRHVVTTTVKDARRCYFSRKVVNHYINFLHDELFNVDVNYNLAFNDFHNKAN